jgi:hypothetical protein
MVDRQLKLSTERLGLDVRKEESFELGGEGTGRNPSVLVQEVGLDILASSSC